jgi:hypothetical protein
MNNGWQSQQAAQRAMDDMMRSSRQSEAMWSRQRARRRAGKSNGHGLVLAMLIAVGAYIYFAQPALWHSIQVQVVDVIHHLQH